MTNHGNNGWKAHAGMPQSARESLVCQLVADGMTNNQIAAELGIELPTVKTHLVMAFRKLGVESRLQLALRIIEERTSKVRQQKEQATT